ncbi:MAG: SIS domain-containing protein [Alphaproteobacteria bacterium]|nr:SIS domain-containing protein [Alphaproteobacteria bacterium]
MFEEASEAPLVVEKQLRINQHIVAKIVRRLQALSPRAVVTAARGSSDNAATYAKYLIETKLGVLTSSAAPSVSSVYSAPAHLNDVVYLAISQSGRSPDILASVEAAKRAGAFTVGLVNTVDSPLAEKVDEVLPLHAGAERSVAATKSYIATCTAVAQLVSAWCIDTALINALDGLPVLLANSWRLDWNAAVAKLCAARDLYVIARGIGFGAAQEAALKLKETCALHAEAFSAAEVRHGPMALAQNGFPVLVMSQEDETRQGICELVEVLHRNRAEVLLAGYEDAHALNLPSAPAHPALQPVLFLQSFYRMAESLSRARGLNPDQPPHLNKITETI